MPPRNARPCARSGCPRLAEIRGRCRPCAAELDAARNADREPELAVYHSKRWAVVRAHVLLDRPWCEIPGCSNPSTDVDHEPRLVEVLEVHGDPYDPGYLRALCHPHHARKTRSEGTRPRR